MKTAGPLRICINESCCLVDNPTFFFAHDEIPIKRVAENWNPGCRAILEPDRARFAVSCGIPVQRVHSYIKRTMNEFHSVNDAHEIVETNSLIGMTGTVHSAIHFCRLIGVGSVKMVGFEGIGGYASQLNVPVGGGRHTLIRSDSIELLNLLDLEFEFLNFGLAVEAGIPQLLDYRNLYDRLREHGYHKAEDESSQFAKHLLWISENLDAETVLDVGCSTGRSLELFREIGKKVTGVEISSVAVTEAHALGRNVILGCRHKVAVC